MAQPISQWQLTPERPTPELDKRVPRLVAQVLAARGVDTSEKLRLFLEPPHRLPYNPLRLPGMELALPRLFSAVQRGERVGIFGDFDVDGVTGTAIIADGLGALGVPVEPYLPHRVDEGHGLSDDAVGLLSEKGVGLIVTVDCGVTSVDEVARSKQLGMDVIITDHHTPSERVPQATAIINPRMPGSSYPYDGLCGAGLAFKLVQGIYDYLGQPWNRDLLELAALGTIADLVPLVDENRYIVSQGLMELARTRRPGLRALCRRAGIQAQGFNTETVSYQLAPRLNAPGRMDHALASYQLLTTTSEAEAEALADQVEGLNQERRALTEQALAVALAEVQLHSPVPPILLVDDPVITPGVAGLVAGRLSEMFHRPAVVMSSVADQRVTASARSIPEFNLIEAFTACSDLFVRFGGHSQAAGFTLLRERVPELREELSAIAAAALSELPLAPITSIDADIGLAELGHEALEWLLALEPYGVGNPQPVFLTRGAQVTASQYVGRQGRHVKLRVRQGREEWTALMFDQAEKWQDSISNIDLVYSLLTDYWNGERQVNLRVLDFRPSAA